MAMKSEGKSLESWINQKCPGVWICTVCGSQTWKSDDKVFELRESSGGDVVMGGPVYPVMSLCCRRCGHILLFNAVTVGIVKPTQGK